MYSSRLSLNAGVGIKDRNRQLRVETFLNRRVRKQLHSKPAGVRLLGPLIRWSTEWKWRCEVKRSRPFTLGAREKSVLKSQQKIACFDLTVRRPWPVDHRIWSPSTRGGLDYYDTGARRGSRGFVWMGQNRLWDGMFTMGGMVKYDGRLWLMMADGVIFIRQSPAIQEGGVQVPTYLAARGWVYSSAMSSRILLAAKTDKRYAGENKVRKRWIAWKTTNILLTLKDLYEDPGRPDTVGVEREL